MSFPRRQQTIAAALLLAVPVAIVLRDALFGGGLLMPGGFLYTVIPWSVNAPADIARLNPQLSDVPLQMYPWALFARGWLRAGEIPLWNPLVLSGTPFFTNAQAAIFSPFNLPVWLLPVRIGLALAAFLKLWLAGIGAYLLARELKCGFWPAVLSGVAFSLCAFNVLWLSHGVHVAVAVLLPWAILLAERGLQRSRPREALLLSLVVAAGALGGHPGTLAHLVGALVLYAVVRGLLVEGLSGRERLSRIAMVLAGAFLGLGLAAFFLVPAGLASRGTVGALERLGGSFTLPDFALVTSAFPDWWGRPTGIATDGLDHFPPVVKGGLFQERTIYAGAVTLLLAAVCALAPGSWRRKAPFVVLGGVGLSVAFGVPGVHWLVTHLPGFDRARDARMTLWFQFSLAMLAAMGLQALVDRRLSRQGLIALSIAAAGVATVAVLVAGGQGFPQAARHFAWGGDPTSAGAVAMTAVIWWLLFAAGTLLLAALLNAGRGPTTLLMAVLVVLAAADMVRFADGYQPAAPPSIAAPGRTQLTDFLAPRQAAGRTIAVGGGLLSDGLPADYGMRFGIRAIRGYDPPQPDAAYQALLGNLRGLSGPGPLPASATNSLSVVEGRWVVTAHGARPPAISGLVRAHAGRDGDVWENPAAVGRVRVAGRPIAVWGLGSALAALASSGVRPGEDAVVELPRGNLPQGVPSRSSGRAKVVGETNTGVSIAAVMDDPGLVVLADRLTDGWSVTVDGRAARAVRVDAAMRGVFVPAGMHVVEWRYAVPGLDVGVAVSIVSLAAWLLAAVFFSRRKPRRR